LALEGGFESVVVVERTAGSMIDRVGSELSRNVDRFCEVRLGPDRVALVPHFSLAQPPPCDTPAITADDVVLVTGGAKGIGAECALRLGVRTGARLIFCGRSSPDSDAVAATLERASALRIPCRYGVSARP